MAPIPDREMFESQSTAAVVAVSALVSALVSVLIVFAIINCGCGKDKTEKKAEEAVEKPTSGNAKDSAGAASGGSVKKASDGKKQDFAAARDPNYRSLMGVDGNFEPSNKAK